MTGDCNWRSNRAWFGYSAARSFNFYGNNAKVVVVGSIIDRKGNAADGMRLKGSNNKFTVNNSVVKGVRCIGNGEECIYISGASNSAKLFNNYLSGSHELQNYTNSFAASLVVEDTTDVVFANNICSFSSSTHPANMYMVIGQFGVTVMNNLAIDNNNTSGGVVAYDTSSGDPLFVDSNPYALDPASPCINAGTSDARYNDRDGSRNDIGPSGGAWYDPDGWTTENPVVISFDLSIIWRRYSTGPTRRRSGCESSLISASPDWS